MKHALLGLLILVAGCSKNNDGMHAYRCYITDSIGTNMAGLAGQPTPEGIVGSASPADTTIINNCTQVWAEGLMNKGYIPDDTIMHRSDSLIIKYFKYADCQQL